MYTKNFLSKPKDPSIASFGTYDEITNKKTKLKVEEKLKKNVVKMVSELKKMFGTPKGSMEASQATTTTLALRRTSRCASAIFTASKLTQTPPSRKIDTTKVLTQIKNAERKKPRNKQKEKRENITLVNVDDDEEDDEEEIKSYILKTREKRTRQQQQQETSIEKEM